MEVCAGNHCDELIEKHKIFDKLVEGKRKAQINRAENFDKHLGEIQELAEGLQNFVSTQAKLYEKNQKIQEG